MIRKLIFGILHNDALSFNGSTLVKFNFFNNAGLAIDMYNKTGGHYGIQFGEGKNIWFYKNGAMNWYKNLS